MGWCLLAALIAVCGGVLGLLLCIVRRRSSLTAVVWTWGASVLSVALAVARIAEERQQVVPLLLRPSQLDPSQVARLMTESFARVLITQLFVSTVLAVAMLALLVAALVGRPKLPQLWLATLAASLVLLTAVAVHVGTERVNVPRACSHAEGNWSASDASACWFELVSESALLFQLGARYAIYAGALGWAVALLRVIRAARKRMVTDGIMSGSRVSLASTVLLFAGVSAFWATRAEHADAQHLLRPDPPNVFDFPLERLRDQLPAATPSCSAREGPVIALHADGAYLDGTRMRDPVEMQDALTRKRELWQQLSPDREFPGLVLLAAARGEKPADVVPWLVAAEDAGYKEIGALLKVPTAVVQTRTVGTLEIKRSCVEVWQLSKYAYSYFTFPSLKTWADLVAARGATPPPTVSEPRSSERSRCGLLSAPLSPKIASLFGKVRHLRNRDELHVLMDQGQSGAPERIALRVQGTGTVDCECPPFDLHLFDPDTFDPEEGYRESISLLAVPKKGVKNFGLRRTYLNLILVGYFSGAWIDSYEYLHTQGEDNPVTDEETRGSYAQTAAEFCLEASCFTPREFQLRRDPEDDADARKYYEEGWNYWRGLAAQDAADMARIGIPRCQGEWMREPVARRSTSP